MNVSVNERDCSRRKKEPQATDSKAGSETLDFSDFSELF